MREDLRTVPIFVQHPLDGVQLADDFSHADNRGAALLFGMVVMIFRHGGSIRGEGRAVNNHLTTKGDGGIP